MSDQYLKCHDLTGCLHCTGSLNYDWGRLYLTFYSMSGSMEFAKGIKKTIKLNYLFGLQLILERSNTIKLEDVQEVVSEEIDIGKAHSATGVIHYKIFKPTKFNFT